MAFAVNPILPGFNPDPSILCVNQDYYIATSTFEWFPGVQIHHSTDLIHWELICRPLKETHLNMLGNPNSGGVWAPCLSYDQGTFYLIFTNVRSYNGIFKDTHNYFVTSDHIMGPWSEPVYLNSSGFDPSLFHDKDGRKWLVSMLWDYRTWKNSFGGILLQEYSVNDKKLIGKPRNVFQGTSLGFTEGPHLYRKDDYYYLLTAEGGTSYSHAVTLARSSSLFGPYEVCPRNPILTSIHHPDLELQKAGHASLVEGYNGRWYLVHLCGRPVGQDKSCILGRETCIEEVVWVDGWLQLALGGNSPRSLVEMTGDEAETVIQQRYIRDDFEGVTWNIHFQSLRAPLGERASMKERQGYLRLYGKESLSSLHEQSLLAVRQQDYWCRVVTKVEFYPENFQQMAGLVYYYDTISHYYLYITADETEGRVLTMLCNQLGKQIQPIGAGISLPEYGPLWLALDTNKESAIFSYSFDGTHYQKIGNPLDATVLSDDYYMKIGESRFTGAFIGICCQDLAGQSAYADYDFFEYISLE